VLRDEGAQQQTERQKPNETRRHAGQGSESVASIRISDSSGIPAGLAGWAARTCAVIADPSAPHCVQRSRCSGAAPRGRWSTGSRSNTSRSMQSALRRALTRFHSTRRRARPWLPRMAAHPRRAWAYVWLPRTPGVGPVCAFVLAGLALIYTNYIGSSSSALWACSCSPRGPEAPRTRRKVRPSLD
jgi:hypothetical protein